jgi:hypothetical protein
VKESAERENILFYLALRDEELFSAPKKSRHLCSQVLGPTYFFSSRLWQILVQFSTLLRMLDRLKCAAFYFEHNS